MFEVINFDDGKLGKIFHCSTFDEAVEKACECFTVQCGREPTANVRESLNESWEYTEDCWGVYIGIPEGD